MTASDPLIDTHVGNFRVLRSLGQGAMGQVYLAVHPRVGKEVAIKVLIPGSGDSASRDRFLLEAKTLIAIDHPNIIHVFDFGVLPDGRYYFSMEYLRGATLSSLLSTPVTLAQVTMLVDQICEALKTVHESGFIHRDLKPANIFLVPRGDAFQVKLLDFGITKCLSDKGEDQIHTKTGIVLGTPKYMSPEQLTGRWGKVSHLADIYALGVLVYRLFSGQYPVRGTTLAELITAHLSEAPVPLHQVRPDMPQNLSRFLWRALAKDPAARPQDAAAFHREFLSATAELDSDMVVTLLPQRAQSGEVRLNEQTVAAPVQPPLMGETISERLAQCTEATFTPYEDTDPRVQATVAARTHEAASGGEEATSVFIKSLGGRSQPKPLLPETTVGARGPRTATQRRLTVIVGAVLLVSALGLAQLFARGGRGRHDTPTPQEMKTPTPPQAPATMGTEGRATHKPPAGAARETRVELTLTANVPGALVRIDGQVVSQTLPVTVKVPRSTAIRIEASRPGYHDLGMTITPTKTRTVRLVLTPKSQAPMGHRPAMPRPVRTMLGDSLI